MDNLDFVLNGEWGVENFNWRGSRNLAERVYKEIEELGVEWNQSLIFANDDDYLDDFDEFDDFGVV